MSEADYPWYLPGLAALVLVAVVLGLVALGFWLAAPFEDGESDASSLKYRTPEKNFYTGWRHTLYLRGYRKGLKKEKRRSERKAISASRGAVS